MKYKLLDSKVIDGIYIDRSKNLSSTYYDVDETPDKITFKRKIKGQQIDFD